MSLTTTVMNGIWHSTRRCSATLLKNYKEHVSAKWLPKFYKTIDSQFGGDYAKYVDYLWNKSLLMKKGAKLYFNKKGYRERPRRGIRNGLERHLRRLRRGSWEPTAILSPSRRSISVQPSSAWRRTCLTTAMPTSPCD